MDGHSCIWSTGVSGRSIGVDSVCVSIDVSGDSLTRHRSCDIPSGSVRVDGEKVARFIWEELLACIWSRNILSSTVRKSVICVSAGVSEDSVSTVRTRYIVSRSIRVENIVVSLWIFADGSSNVWAG